MYSYKGPIIQNIKKGNSCNYTFQPFNCLEEIIKQQSNNLVILIVVTFFSHNSSQKGFPSTDPIKMKNVSYCYWTTFLGEEQATNLWVFMSYWGFETLIFLMWQLQNDRLKSDLSKVLIESCGCIGGFYSKPQKTSWTT